MSQVSGKVLYKDGSVPKGGVCALQLVPQGNNPDQVRKGAGGDIGPDGSFTLYTRKPGDGVHHGDYAVTFSVWKGPMEPVSYIQPKYVNPSTTPYKLTVDGDVSDLKFEIEPLPDAPK